MPTNKKNNKNGFWLILLNDIRVGCKKNILLYILTLLFALISAYSYYKITNRYFQRGDIKVMPGALDYMVYLFGGMKSMYDNANFEIPILWMTIQILVGGSVCIYPVNDLYGNGSVILLQFGSRVKWWISKCIWSILQVCIVYLILIGGMTFCAAYYGGGLQYHTEIASTITAVTISNSKLLTMVVMISPLLYSIMAALVQINLSLAIGPVNSFVCLVAYHVLSVYSSLPVFLGSFSMIYRIRGLTGQGISWLPGLVICSWISIIVMVLGILVFRKSDIMGKKS